MKLDAVGLAERIFPFSVERGVSRRLEPRISDLHRENGIDHAVGVVVGVGWGVFHLIPSLPSLRKTLNSVSKRRGMMKLKPSEDFVPK